MNEAPAERIWAFERNDECFWRDEQCFGGVPYRRADTVVDKDVAEKMAKALKAIRDGTHRDPSDQDCAHTALAAYEEALE